MNVGEMQHKLAIWSTENPERRFNRLLRLISNEEWLRTAAERTLQTQGSRTAGVDGMTRKIFEEKFDVELNALRKELLNGDYRPNPVRRVFIPKQNGKMRPLGIPTLKDRIVQRAMAMAMEPIWESDFHRNSYGFRPGRSVHHAVRAVKIQMTDSGHARKGRWVIEGDLASYFDKVHHRKLIGCIRRRIRDKRFIQLLWRFLRAGQVDKGLFRISTEGVPQGGVISPLLSNIMLNELDRYMEERYVGHLARARRSGWNTSVRNKTPISVREGRREKPCVSYVRYADDFVVVVKGTRSESEAIKEELAGFLASKLNLVLNMEKTHITHINDGFVFLGHHIIRKRSNRGHLRVVTGIPWESYRRFSDELCKLLSGNHHIKAVDMIRKVNQKIQGWTTFYRHTTYSGWIYQRIDTAVFWKLAHWLARRHKGSIKKAMRKWFKASTVLNGTRTWLVHQTIDGETHSVALKKCIGSFKQQRVAGPPTANPYIAQMLTTPVHRCYTEIATITGI